jgi:hypothetical protein
MAMAETNGDEILTDLFAAGQRHAPVPSDGFMERVLSDADQVQARPAVLPRRVSDPVWARLAARLGGWQGLGGLATATIAGLWIGYAGLADPSTLSGGLLGTDEAVELLPEMEFFALAAGTEN